MKRKNIDAAREIRLWIGQIIVPALGLGLAYMSIPEVREYAIEKTKKFKQNIKNKLKKEEA